MKPAFEFQRFRAVWNGLKRFEWLLQNANNRNQPRKVVFADGSRKTSYSLKESDYSDRTVWKRITFPEEEEFKRSVLSLSLLSMLLLPCKILVLLIILLRQQVGVYYGRDDIYCEVYSSNSCDTSAARLSSCKIIVVDTNVVLHQVHFAFIIYIYKAKVSSFSCGC